MQTQTPPLRGRISYRDQEVKAFRNSRGQVVGKLEDGWLVKRGLHYERHHLHRFGAWATERSHIKQLQAVGGKGVRLHLTDGRTLEATLERWLRHAFPIRFDGEQLALADKHWTVNQSGARQLALPLGAT